MRKKNNPIKKKGKTSVKQNRSTRTAKVFFVALFVIVLALSVLNLVKAKGLLIPAQPEPLVVDGVVHLDSFTLEQKIAQMTVVLWVPDLMPVWKNLQMGGVYMYSLATEGYFKQVIDGVQEGMAIPFLVTADAEGCFTPFESFWDFVPNKDVRTVGEAYEKGFHEGQQMKNLGFSMNFAPVVDLDDDIWGCRSFSGDEQQIAELAQAYVSGLQSQGILANAKHYPGKTLIGKDPHKFLAEAMIEKSDLVPYDYLIEKGDVASIMVSHIITTGEIDSAAVPAVVSARVVQDLKRKFPGLVISDEIHMQGLESFYENIDGMYIDVFKAGNDIILNFDKDPNEVHRMIQVVAEAVKDGRIPEEQIDASVKKILEAKGLKVE